MLPVMESNIGRSRRTLLMVCKLCGQQIENVRQAWKEQTGWVSPKGAKSMTGATATGELAHPECISLLRSKVAVGQGSF